MNPAEISRGRPSLLPAQVRAALEAIVNGATAASQESERLDFKQDSDRGDGETLGTLLDAALCFANSSGGVIVLGVSDKQGGTDALLGTSMDADVVRARIHANSRPPLLIDAYIENYLGRRLLIVSVPESPDIHADGKGRAPRRLGTDCIGMEPSEQARLQEERTGIDWSGQPASGRPQLDHDAIAGARRRLAASLSPERRGLAKLSDDDLLRALGSLTRTDYCFVPGRFSPAP